MTESVQRNKVEARKKTKRKQKKNKHRQEKISMKDQPCVQSVKHFMAFCMLKILDIAIKHSYT